MAQVNVSLSDDLERWAEARVGEGLYGSTGDYVCDLIRRDREQVERLRRLQAAIDEGRASGVSGRTIGDVIADGRRRIAQG